MDDQGPTIRDGYMAALEILDGANSVDDLRNAAKQVRPISAQLPTKYVQVLREFYRAKQAELEERTKQVDLHGRPVLINSVTEVQTRIGPSLILEGQFEDTGETFRSWCPGTFEGRVAKFYHDLAPSEFPVRVIHRRVQHPTDPAKTMWTFHRLPKLSYESTDDIPF